MVSFGTETSAVHRCPRVAPPHLTPQGMGSGHFVAVRFVSVEEGLLSSQDLPEPGFSFRRCTVVVDGGPDGVDFTRS